MPSAEVKRFVAELGEQTPEELGRFVRRSAFARRLGRPAVLALAAIGNPRATARAFGDVIEAATYGDLGVVVVVMLNTDERGWPSVSQLEPFFDGTPACPPIAAAALTASKAPLLRYAGDRLRAAAACYSAQRRAAASLKTVLACVNRWAAARGGRGKFAIAGNDGVVRSIVAPILAASLVAQICNVY